MGGKLQINRLVLCTDQLDLARIGQRQDLASGIFGIVAQLPHAEPVTAKRVNIAIDIAKLIVEIGSHHALGQRILDIG